VLWGSLQQLVSKISKDGEPLSLLRRPQAYALPMRRELCFECPISGREEPGSFCR